MAFKVINCLLQASITIKVSSAYWIIEISGECLRDKGRFRRFESFALFRIDCSRSATSTKRRGERGSPCLAPLLQWTVLPGTPFRSTEEVPEERISLIHYIHLAPKPFAVKIWMIASCSTLSNAFSKSNLSIIRFLLDLWQRCKYSRAQATQY